MSSRPSLADKDYDPKQDAGEVKCRDCRKPLWVTAGWHRTADDDERLDRHSRYFPDELLRRFIVCAGCFAANGEAGGYVRFAGIDSSDWRLVSANPGQRWGFCPTCGDRRRLWDGRYCTAQCRDSARAPSLSNESTNNENTDRGATWPCGSAQPSSVRYLQP